MDINCPCCFKKLDSNTAAFEEGAKPGKGDISVCLYCGNVMEFIDSDHVKEVTPAEIMKWEPETRQEIAKVQAAIIGMIKRN